MTNKKNTRADSMAESGMPVEKLVSRKCDSTGRFKIRLRLNGLISQYFLFVKLAMPI
jgi:hypothetical protein